MGDSVGYRDTRTNSPQETIETLNNPNEKESCSNAAKKDTKTILHFFVRTLISARETSTLSLVIHSMEWEPNAIPICFTNPRLNVCHLSSSDFCPVDQVTTYHVVLSHHTVNTHAHNNRCARVCGHAIYACASREVGGPLKREGRPAAGQ